MGDTVALDVPVVVFAGPDVASLRFHSVGHHVVNQSVLVPYLVLLELLTVLLFVNSLKNILKTSIVFLEDGVFGSEVEGVLPVEGKLETALGELFDAFVSVVHGHAYAALAFELVDLSGCLLATLSPEGDFEGAWFVDDKVSGLVLVSEGVASDDDGFFPGGDEARHVFDDDRLSEDGAI